MNKASRYHHRKVLYNLLLMLAVVLVSCGENDKGQAEFQQGETAYAARDYSNASQYYQKAAERGHVEAQICIANCYWNGQGVERNDRQAIKWYFEAAKQGNTEAWYRIGVCYAEGRGVERDWEAAARWFQKAADRGHADAMYKLGQGYRFARGINKDDKKADEYYQKAAEVWLVAAEQGDAEAQFMLATCYSNGNGVNKSKTEALKWYQKAAEQGIADAQYQMGLHCLGLDANNNSSTKAAEWFQKAAEQGHSEAQFELGKCYEKGLGVIWDYVQAFDWYSKAAEQGIADAQTKADSLLDTVLLLKAAAKGNAEAMLELGIRFEQGKKIPKDLKESLKWYRKAAESGDAEAQFKLAQKYINGLGVSKDETEAVKWYRKAAEQDNAEAQFQLGKSYENGIGIKQDYSEAFQWYSKAAEQGHADAQSKADFLRDVVRLLEKAGRGDAEAMFKLSICFENGESIAKDLSEALHWIRKAAEQGHLQAQYKLALDYENGTGVRADFSEAAKWYRKAAEQGHVEAQYKLALAYENGYGITQDLSEAVKWYHKAAEQGYVEASRHLQSAEVLLAAQNGNAEAQYNLALAYENGNGMTKDLSEAVKWYRKAAEQGHAGAQKKLKTAELLLNAQNGNAEAQYKLAQAYEKGSGVTKDLTEAMAWYHKAAEQGHAEAQYKLATAYESGTGVGVNLSEALKWNRKAAEQGIAEAQYKLALAYENGTGVRADFSEAANWYRKAAEQDNAGAQYKLGLYYEKVKTDLSEAANWYRKAVSHGHQEAQSNLKNIELFLDARNGNADAQYKLGLAYEKGEGVEKDTSQAVSWFDLAAKQGHAEAKKTIQKYRLTIELPDGAAPLEMVRVTAGSFMMSAADGRNRPNEVPHQATLTHDFYIARTEVTNAQSKALLGSPRYSDNRPVHEISWYDAMVFCEKLNQSGKAPIGWKFTLPTETQWEFAARGGYDRIGNVWEWCLDDWNEDSSAQKAEFSRGKGSERDSTFRVYRGGPSSSKANQLAVRSYGCANNEYSGLGFRVALVQDTGSGSVSTTPVFLETRPAGTPRGTTTSSSTSTSTTTSAKQTQSQFDEIVSAAKKGNAAAQYKLAKAYESGSNGMSRNPSEALNWYRKAAEQGNADACYELGNCYYHGIFVYSNYDEGIKWYKKAAELGSADACWELGYCYEYGGKVYRNDEESFKWYHKAAELGKAAAQYKMGKHYQRRIGTDGGIFNELFGIEDSNKTEAIKWFRKAAEQGDEDAKKALKQLTGK